MRTKLTLGILIGCSFFSNLSYAHPASHATAPSSPQRPISDNFNWGTGPGAAFRPELSSSHSDSSLLQSDSDTHADFNWGTGPG